MIGTLFKNEWRAILRDGRGLMILATAVILAALATWTSASTDQRERAGQQAATESAREAWLARDVDHPHSRAHYGDYVFRPNGPLSGLDPGLQAVTGRAVFTEAHRQNVDVHRPQEDAATLLRFDRLEPSTVLQLLVPLVLILAGFASVASERESGRLKLLTLQGVAPRTLLLAKTLALFSLGAALCLLVVGLHGVLASDLHAGRAFTYLAVHLANAWIVAAVVTSVSAWLRRPGTAAGLLLFLWGCGAIVLPRLASMTAETLHPLPNRDAFDSAMREDRERGLDGHNPHDERRQALEKEILAEYGVESSEELPIDIGGLLMQADEEYGHQVWDKHFGQLEQNFVTQFEIAGSFALANPFQATDRLSMVIAGTGLTSHLGFLRQVESYRRTLVKKLNDEHAFGGSAPGKRGWMPEAEFYQSFDTFEFTPPPLGDSLRRHALDLAALALWLFGSTGALFLSARRLRNGGAL